MSSILITGGTGELGGVLAAQLAEAGHSVRVLSRRAPAQPIPGVAYVQVDLASGAGLAEALTGIDRIVHAASSPNQDTAAVDVAGTATLLAQARAAGVVHILYISIVGIEQLPTSYYRHKLAAEERVRAGGVPWSIQRATQFHSLVDGMLGQLERLPLPLMPAGLRFQPVAVPFVAAQLAKSIMATPGGTLTDVGGPKIYSISELARLRLAARGKRPRVIGVPLPGRLLRAFRTGAATCPNGMCGGQSWDEWLQERYGDAHRQPAV